MLGQQSVMSQYAANSKPQFCMLTPLAREPTLDVVIWRL